MAYRRRQVVGRSSTFKEDQFSPSEDGDRATPFSPSSSLAAQAIIASAAHRDSSHSAAYAHPGFKGHEKVRPLFHLNFLLICMWGFLSFSRITIFWVVYVMADDDLWIIWKQKLLCTTTYINESVDAIVIGVIWCRNHIRELFQLFVGHGWVSDWSLKEVNIFISEEKLGLGFWIMIMFI